MKILNNEENLASFLEDIREREVTIVSAFASGTESVIDLLLDHGNRLELLIGTINSFSSPDLFDHCKNIANDNFSLFVDFGYQSSIHWKLYLIEPETVIIGSANFTVTGLSLMRDTCVVIENKTLLESYIKELAAIKSSNNVVSCDGAHFEDYLQKYRENHRRMQAGRARSVRAGDGNEWLSAEENQLIPVLIWDSRHTKDTIEEAHKLLKEDSDEEPASMLRDFFTYDCDEADLPYSQGDLVLCMNSKGSYADFYSFDRILHEDGINYIYSYKQKRYTRPFRLSNEIKSEIKNRVGDWYEREITELGRAEIQDVIKSANK
ncbi:phospholipase D family protein [Methylotuvimicrobium buryatense]|uniref:NgoFVII family restriction endonuclease n=1 Tax=Methylotuvimicrobium buryatense TaxID=95641 RepID=A0A4P9UN95_METBY|nr:phospholipase D family protein [Methylotuvimicrobium buryatense]QCW82829.1 NgoFVII family restriction endonuclease [Methylotuvimicrobium buryatense]